MPLIRIDDSGSQFKPVDVSAETLRRICTLAKTQLVGMRKAEGNSFPKSDRVALIAVHDILFQLHETGSF